MPMLDQQASHLMPSKSKLDTPFAFTIRIRIGKCLTIRSSRLFILSYSIGDSRSRSAREWHMRERAGHDSMDSSPKLAQKAIIELPGRMADVVFMAAGLEVSRSIRRRVCRSRRICIDATEPARK